MTNNILMRVVNDNNEERILSGSIIVELLKNYTSDWGKISSSSVIEDTVQPLVSGDSNIELFNEKIGYVAPKFSLSQIIEEVVEAIREENPDYVMDYHSFNDIEKIAIYFILRVNNNRSIKEVFDTLNNNYDDISKRDLLIKYLTEVSSPETDRLRVNPIYTLYNIFNFMKTHEPREYNFNSNKDFKGKLEFKEYSFPMHSYNVTTRYAPLAHQNKAGYSGDVRNYRETFNASFLKNNTPSSITTIQENIIRNKSVTGEAVLQKKIIDEKYPGMEELINNLVVPEDAPKEAKYIIELIKKRKYSYRTLLMIANRDDNYMDANDGDLVKYLSENFFDYSPANNKLLSLSPFTMAYPNGSDVPSNYKFGTTTHSSNFNRFKTIMSYYVSDINFWLTANNNDYANYVYNKNNNTDILPSNSKVETKGYFNNLMFLESSIKRILYPKVLEFSKGLYNNWPFKTNKGYDYNKIFAISNEQETYDQIFDSIVNNAYIFTDRNATGTNLNLIKPNYEYLTGRLLLNNPNDKLISKPNTINEFILNYIINSGSDVYEGNRHFSTNEKFSKTNKFPTAADYDVLSTNITTEFDSGNSIHYLKLESPTYGTNLTNTLEYKFDELFEPDKNLIKDVVASYIGNASGINKNIRYKDTKFFKLPVHSSENINRSIVRTTREMLLDISDITNFDIEGMSTADLTYGEKALLEEYISEYRSFNNLRDETNVQVIEQMLEELKKLRLNTRDKTKSYYFPDWIRDQSGAIKAIEDLLKRSVYKVTRFNKSRETSTYKQIKELYKHRAVDVEYKTQKVTADNGRISGKRLDKEFLKNIRIIINEIALTNEFKSKLEDFNTKYQTGDWLEVVNALDGLRDELIDDDNIEPIMSKFNMYKGTDKSLLKKLDTSIYKLIIKNFFSYLTDTEITSNLNDTTALIKMLLTDNDNNGILKYYSDLIELMKFLESYIELLPEYVDYINNNIIDRYYEIIKAVHKLPSWDYESFHIRDREKDLKLSSGINKHDYNIVWDYNPTRTTRSKNMRIVYTKQNTINTSFISDDYRISEPIYKGGFTNKDVDEKNWFEQRDKWWRRWIKSDGNTDGFLNKKLFKVPNVEFVDMNVNIDTDNWNWDSPLITPEDDKSSNRFKRDLFAKMNNVSALPYVGDGKIANLSSFKYITSNANGYHYENIGVPLLLLDQEAHKEYNLSNTIRDKSFSFEHIFLNMWFTDENFDNKTKETRALTFRTQKLISLAQEYKHFGIGNIDLQKLFRHYWNWESTPMTNTSTVMNHEIFPTWDSGYNYSKGHFPWSTSTSREMNAWLFWLTGPLISWLFAKDVPVSNKYLMGYVLEPRYGNNHNVSWMPVRLNGDMEEPHYVYFWDDFQENRDGVAGTVTHEQISSNFYWKIKGESFSFNKMKDAALDIWNRNLRNRIYISLFNWRHINGNILTKVDNYTPIVIKPPASTGTSSSSGGGLSNSNISKQIKTLESVVM